VHPVRVSVRTACVLHGVQAAPAWYADVHACLVARTCIRARVGEVRVLDRMQAARSCSAEAHVV
jgi:hypothetical protein